MRVMRPTICRFFIAAVFIAGCVDDNELLGQPADFSGPDDELYCPGLSGSGGYSCEEPCRFHVDSLSTNPVNGASWSTAFDDIQTGINNAYCTVDSCDNISRCEVWVARGNYYIYKDDSKDTVRLRSKVDLLGGFDKSEAEAAERGVEENIEGRTYLIGHGSSDTEPDDDIRQVFHVVTASHGSAIDGFVLANGLANGDGELETVGAGLLVKDADFSMYNCAVENCNTTVPKDKWDGFGGGTNQYSGGGIAVVDGSLSLVNGLVADNNAYNGGGLYAFNSRVDIKGSTFLGNNAVDGGGAARLEYGVELILEDSRFYSNGAFGLGGAIGSVPGDLGPKIEVNQCLFMGNTGSNGAAIWTAVAGDYPMLSIVNSTFTGNFSSYIVDEVGGGAVFVDFLTDDFESVEAVNSVLWNNGGGDLVFIDSNGDNSTGPKVNHCVMEHSYPGAGNVVENPLYSVVPMELGYYDVVVLQPSASSPVIDAGDGDAAPEFDILGAPRCDLSTVPNTGTGDPDYTDIGAFEYQL